MVGEALMAIMDRKHHWAYGAFATGALGRPQLLVHYRHEYLVYVRDFPALLARALGVTPPLDDVRAALAENLYEEQTGGVSQTKGHPRLFLQMMAGLGFEPNAFADDVADLHPAALSYAEFLRARACAAPWQAAVALLTIFVEGSVNERAELAGTFVRKTGEEAVRHHPLVKHYGCPPEAMQLTRAHAAVEGAHRRDAWRVVLDHVREGDAVARAVVDTCSEALAAWHAYRDGVAERMGLRREDAARG
jgi:pyrroloquinoline quinone (PQQ) biosynthesis protein C